MKKRSYKFSIALCTVLIQIVIIALPGYLFASCGMCVEEKREAPQREEKKGHDCCASKTSHGRRDDVTKKEHPSKPMPLSCTCCIKKVEPIEPAHKIWLENSPRAVYVTLPVVNLNARKNGIIAGKTLEKPEKTPSILPIYIEVRSLLI